MALVSVYVAEKLQPYFQAHTITIITEYLLKTAFGKPEKSARLHKWSILLVEFGLKYKPKISEKGRALAYFLVYYPIEDPNPTPRSIPN